MLQQSLKKLWKHSWLKRLLKYSVSFTAATSELWGRKHFYVPRLYGVPWPQLNP